MKYLHLINDTRFTNFAENIFEQSNPGNNVFLIGVKNHELSLQNTRLTGTMHVSRIRSKEYYQFIEDTDFDVLVVHFLHDYKVIAVNKINRAIKIVWLVWGGDIKLTKSYKKNIYHPITKKILRNLHNPWGKIIKSRFRDIYYYFTTGSFPLTGYKKAVAKVDYCGTVVPYEFDILASSMDFFHATKVPFAYGSIEDNLGDIEENDYVNGNGILIGNSIDPSSNHMDVLDILHKHNITDRDLILPLNYGENIEYRGIIMEKGKYLFGERFKPLLNFLPSSDYVNVMKSCNVAIMYHEQQQALGNLICLLWLGCKVFMSENSIVYTYFRERGIRVYSFQSEFDSENINIPVSASEIETNRKLLIMEYDDNAVLNKVKTLVNTVSGEKFVMNDQV